MNFNIDLSATEFTTHNAGAIDTSKCEEYGSIGVPYEFLTQTFGAPAKDSTWAVRFGDGMTAHISRCGCNADDQRPNEERIAWHIAGTSKEVVERLRMIVEAWDEAKDAEREAKGEQIPEVERIARAAAAGAKAADEMLDTIQSVKGLKFRLVVEGAVDIMKFRTLVESFSAAAIKGGRVPEQAAPAISAASDTLSSHLLAKLTFASGLTDVKPDLTQQETDALVDEIMQWATRVYKAQTDGLGALALNLKG